jgi:hypothetical protein
MASSVRVAQLAYGTGGEVGYDEAVAAMDEVAAGERTASQAHVLLQHREPWTLSWPDGGVIA